MTQPDHTLQIQELENKVKRLEEILELQTKAHKSAREEIQNFNHLKDNFLSIASHELRTPMSVIRGYADLLLSHDFGQLNDQQNDFVRKILRNTEALTQLVNNMLDISKLEAGKMQYDFKTVKIFDLLTQTVADHQVLFQKKQQTLSFHSEVNPSITIETDAEKLSIVLKNLISNAHKFTPKKGQVEVRLLTESKTNSLKIQIIDTGIGIPMEERAAIFKKFQQVDHSLQKKHSGTGLGLSITKKIIEQLEGEIWIEDNPDHPTGIIFNITLPA